MVIEITVESLSFKSVSSTAAPLFVRVVIVLARFAGLGTPSDGDSGRFAEEASVVENMARVGKGLELIRIVVSRPEAY